MIDCPIKTYLEYLQNLLWSCPLDYTNFILSHDIKLLLLTYVLSQKLIYFPFLFFHKYYLAIFVKLYDHMLHFLFFFFMYKFCFAEWLVSTHLYDHAPNVWYFCFVSSTLFFMYSVNVCILYMFIFCITVLKTILSLMPATSYPKAIGGVS